MKNRNKLIYQENYEELRKILPGITESFAYHDGGSIQLGSRILTMENLAQDTEKRCSRVYLSLCKKTGHIGYKENTSVEIMVEHMVGLAIGHSYVNSEAGDCSYPNDLLREWLYHVNDLGFVLSNTKEQTLSDRIKKIVPDYFYSKSKLPRLFSTQKN